ncbi:MAG: translocation/assembly module TamB domain-containing protein [Terriglobia bacterium]
MSRTRILKKIFLVALAVVLALIVAAILVLRSGAFHRYALGAMISRAEQATGGKVTIGDFTFHLSGIRVDLYRITLHGTEPPSAPPLCSIEHIGVNLRIISLIQRKVAVRKLEIDQPVIHLTINAAGQSNLPHPANRNSGKPLNLFSTEIGHLTIRRGEADLNDRVAPLEASLRNVRADVSFDALKTEYDGVLSYRDGEIRLGQEQPLRHNFELHFTAGPNGARADPLIVSTAASRATIHASLTSYSNPVIKGSYSISVATAEIARVVNTSTLPVGIVATEGSFEYRRQPNVPLLDSLALTGRMSSSRLAMSVQGERVAVAAVRSSYSLAAGTFTVHDLSASVLGGSARAEVVIRDVAANPRFTVSGSLRSISLRGVRAVMGHYPEARLPVDGRLNASVDASWKGNLKALHARSDATLRASLRSGTARSRGGNFSLEGAAHLAYDSATGTLTLRQTDFRTPASEVTLDGSVGPRSALSVVAQTRDLREPDALIAEIRTIENPRSPPAAPFGLSGSATFWGLLQGSPKHLRLAGRLEANSLAVRNVAVPRLQTQVALSASGITLTDGQVQAAQGSAQFQASVGLRNWGHSKSSAVSLQLVANGMSIAQLEKIARKNYPVSGILTARIAVHGSVLHPAGTGTIQVSKGEAWKEPLEGATLRFQGSGNTIHATASVQTRAGDAAAELTYNPQSQAYDGAVTLNHIRLDRLQALKRGRVPVSGVLNASIRGRGNLKAPQAQAALSLPTLRIGQQTITAVSARATIANQTATLAFNANFSGAPARAQGTIRLAGDYQSNVSFHSGTIDAGPLLRSYLPGSAGDLQCQVQVEGWLRGPLKHAQEISAHADIPALRLAHGATGVSLVAPLTADYQHDVLVVHPAELKGSGTDFHVQARIPLAAGAPLNGSLDGVVDFHMLQMMYPDWATAGQIELNFTAQGSRSHPEFQGRMRLVDASIEPASAPIGVQNMNATVAITNGRAEITSFTAQSGGGSITASGSVAYAHGVTFSLALNAQNVRVRYPQGVREVLGGNVRFSGTLESSLISGQISILQLSLTQAFDLTTFTSQFNVVSVPSGEEAGLTDRIKLRVAVRSARELSLNSSEVNLRGTANLLVQGTVANPVVIGRATLTGGEIFFDGRRFQVEHGVVDFVNPVTTEPVVNIGLVTTVDQYTLRLNFIGPFDRLRTTYSSDPALAPADAVHLLLTGSPTEQQGTGLGVQSILAQGIGSTVSGRVQKLTGISSLTIDPQMGGNGSNLGARIAVQQRVTRKLFFTFSVDTATTQEDVIQLQYQLNRRWSVEAMRNQDGGYSLEIRSRKTF